MESYPLDASTRSPKAMSDGGKGSGRRPLQVPTDQFNDNWDAIFGKKEPHSLDGLTGGAATEHYHPRIFDSYEKVESDERKEKEA